MLLFFDQVCGTFGTGFHYVTAQLKKKWMSLFMKDVGWFGTKTFFILELAKIGALIGRLCHFVCLVTELWVFEWPMQSEIV